jgi:ubiquitin-protein ligase
MSDSDYEYEYEDDDVAKKVKEPDDEEPADQVKILEIDADAQRTTQLLKFLSRLTDITIYKYSAKYYEVQSYINDKIVFYKDFNIDILIEYINQFLTVLTEDEYLKLIDYVGSYKEVVKTAKSNAEMKASYAKNYGSGTAAKFDYKKTTRYDKMSLLKEFYNNFDSDLPIYQKNLYMLDYVYGLLVEIYTNDESPPDLVELSDQIIHKIHRTGIRISNMMIVHYSGLSFLSMPDIELFRLTKLKRFSHGNWSGMTSTDTKAIMKQMKILKDPSSLILNDNSNIFVAFDEDRVCQFKFMITGPVDTPYEYGCYIFDGLIKDFPNKPPHVTIMTTDGGRVRFNPNLYSNGKVCLSLLGTWAGPSWDPANSTILQILLSIQVQIMVSEPYYNEPGYTNNDEKSKAYNENIYKENVTVAILGALEKPDPDFTEAIGYHFRKYREKIEASMTKNNVSENLIKKFNKLVDGYDRPDTEGPTGRTYPRT